MPLPSPPDPTMATRDALRGLRLVLKRGAKLSVEKARVAVPGPFEGVSEEFFAQANKFTDAADSLVQQMLGLDFHEDRFSAPATLRQSPSGAARSERMRDASNLYFALSLSVRYFDLSQLFVSETVCALIISAARLDEQEREDSCVWLFRQLGDSRAIESPSALVRRHTPEEQSQIAMVAFAVSLWSFVDRNAFNDPELELLEICCDVAALKLPEIDLKLAGDNELSVAFKSALEIV